MKIIICDFQFEKDGLNAWETPEWQRGDNTVKIEHFRGYNLMIKYKTEEGSITGLSICDDDISLITSDYKPIQFLFSSPVSQNTENPGMIPLITFLKDHNTEHPEIERFLESYSADLQQKRSHSTVNLKDECMSSKPPIKLKREKLEESSSSSSSSHYHSSPVPNVASLIFSAGGSSIVSGLTISGGRSMSIVNGQVIYDHQKPTKKNKHN